MTPFLRPICFALALALAQAAPAQTPDPFAQSLNEALAEAGEEAALLECAGLIRALGETAPEDSDLAAQTEELEADLAVFATMVRQSETGADMEAAMDMVAPAIFAVSDLYLDRMRANQAAEGSVLDPQMEERLAFCRELRDQLTEGTEDAAE